MRSRSCLTPGDLHGDEVQTNKHRRINSCPTKKTNSQKERTVPSPRSAQTPRKKTPVLSSFRRANTAQSLPLLLKRRGSSIIRGSVYGDHDRSSMKRGTHSAHARFEGLQTAGSEEDPLKWSPLLNRWLDERSQVSAKKEIY